MITVHLLAYLTGGLGILMSGVWIFATQLQVLGQAALGGLLNLSSPSGLRAIAIGFLTALFVQSGITTTVTALGYINSGLMSFSHAMGFFLGAQVGASLTAWLVALNLGKNALGLLCIGYVIQALLKAEKMIALGKALMALGFIFLGFSLMLEGGGSIISHGPLITASDIRIILILTLTGAILTALLESTIAGFATTAALTASGIIDLSAAVALLLGHNLGATLPAIRRSRYTNLVAKRVAGSHFLVQLTGVVVVIFVFPSFMEAVELLVPSMPFSNHDIYGYKLFYLAAAHCSFNILVMVGTLPFWKLLDPLARRLIPDRKLKEVQHLVFKGTSEKLAPAMAIELLAKELKKLAAMVQSILDMTKNTLFFDRKNIEITNKISKYCRIIRTVQSEMQAYNLKVVELPLSASQSKRLTLYLSSAQEMTEVAQACQKMISNDRHLEALKKVAQGRLVAELSRLMGLVISVQEAAFNQIMGIELLKGHDPLDRSSNFYNRLKVFRQQKIEADYLPSGMKASLLAPVMSEITSALEEILQSSLRILQSFKGPPKRY